MEVEEGAESQEHKKLGAGKDKETNPSPGLLQGFPSGSQGKESTHNAGDPGSSPGSARSPGEENGDPFQIPVFLPGESHGQRRQAGYRP